MITEQIRLHDEVVSSLARLFRCLRVDATVEPIHSFAEASGNGNNQRPDILLRNPRGFSRQIILDVAGLELMVNPERVTIFRIDLCKSVMSRRWLNMVRLRTRIDFSLSLLFFLTLGKFMVLLRVCLGSRFVKSWLLLKARLSHLRLSL